MANDLISNGSLSCNLYVFFNDNGCTFSHVDWRVCCSWQDPLGTWAPKNTKWEDHAKNLTKNRIQATRWARRHEHACWPRCCGPADCAQWQLIYRLWGEDMITACTVSRAKFSLYDARSVGPSFLLIASVSWGWQQKRDAANLGIDADIRCVCKLLGRSHR